MVDLRLFIILILMTANYCLVVSPSSIKREKKRFDKNWEIIRGLSKEEEQDPFKAIVDCVDHDNGKEGDPVICQELDSSCQRN